jgi:hypothetical protein
MTQRLKWFQYLMAGIVVSMLAAPELHACMRSLAEIKVPPSFRVSVVHEQEPVSGIPVAVYDAKDLSASAAPIVRLLTGKDGKVEIRDLREGKYIVVTEGPGQGDGVYAIVSNDNKTSNAGFALQWPFSRQEILQLKALAGELSSNDPWTPFANIHLELWTAGGSAPLAVQETGPEGRFNFNSTRPGIYILRIQGHQKDVKPDNQIEGELPVELSPSAPEASASVYLRLETSDCGIEYSSCPSGNDTPLETAARQFQVVYGPGIEGEYPWIKNVRFKLLDDHGTSIAEGRTDEKGMATLPSDFAGRASLLVADWGLTSLRQSLDLLPANEGTPALVVSMGGLMGEGHCSSVSLEKNATP